MFKKVLLTLTAATFALGFAFTTTADACPMAASPKTASVKKAKKATKTVATKGVKKVQQVLCVKKAGKKCLKWKIIPAKRMAVKAKIKAAKTKKAVKVIAVTTAKTVKK